MAQKNIADSEDISSDKIILLLYKALEIQPFQIKLVSKELIHFGVIARLFRQIGVYSSRFVLSCSFLKTFNYKTD